MTSPFFKQSVSSHPTSAREVSYPSLRFFCAKVEGKTIYLMIPNHSYPSFMKLEARRYGELREISAEKWLEQASYSDIKKADQHVSYYA